MGIPGLKKYQCTTCRYTEYIVNKGYPDEQNLKLSDVVRQVPEQYLPDTEAWALHCETAHTGWYNPYQECDCWGK